MGTRSGDLDPGAVLYLVKELPTLSAAKDVLNEQAGLLGVSGISSDMQELLAKETGDHRAAEAIALFCYQARKFLGSLAAVLSGLDTLVFTGGIGENAPSFEAASAKAWSFSVFAWIRRLTALMLPSSRPKAVMCEYV